ncbi:heparinase II/III family protein [Nitrospira moscoviensis]|nr:alginate lyase family protein [Nitrospira moscoviensis]
MFIPDSPTATISGRPLSWYAKRLSVMQPGEVLTRLGSQCGLAVLSIRHHLGLAAAPANRLEARGYRFCRAMEPQLPIWIYRAHLDPGICNRVLAGGLPEGGWNWRWDDEPDVWHTAPDTGRTWPARFFGSIPYREGNTFGDVRRVWEPSRLQQLVTLARIAVEGPAALRERAVGLMEAQFLSWINANPYLTGVHYISAMECGLRLLAVCHAFDQVRPWLRRPERVWLAVVRLVEGHAALIRQRVSLHSSLGNHTIAEATALLYAGLLFPEMPHASRWRMAGLTLLESESSHQVLADGGGIEQGLCYLRFVSDLFHLASALLDARGEPVPDGLEQAVTRSRSFLAAMTDEAGALLSIGDGDGGYALGPVLDFTPAVSGRATGLTTFEASGYTVLEPAGSSGTRLILDHGPLGMAPCYAHGHADALAVLLRTGGQEVLVDPGTYTYTGHPEWRKYFRGTRAHNTVVVDGLDQAVQETAFQWSSPYTSRLLTCKECAGGDTILIAMHDGYLARTGVVHWRGILYRPPGLWVILDRLTGSGTHDLEVNWHLGLTPVPDGDGYMLDGSIGGLRLMVEGGAVAVHRGQTAPIIGWRSSFYGAKEPMDTLRMSRRGTLPHEFVTCVAMGDADGAGRQAAVSRLRTVMDDAHTH